MELLEAEVVVMVVELVLGSALEVASVVLEVVVWVELLDAEVVLTDVELVLGSALDVASVVLEVVV